MQSVDVDDDDVRGVEWSRRHGLPSTPRRSTVGQRVGQPHGDLLVAELAANPVLHGRVPSRDFRLRLTLYPEGPVLRIEVTNPSPDRRPPAPSNHSPPTGTPVVAHSLSRPCPPAGE